MLLDSLEAVEARYQELEKLITENFDDYQQIAGLSKEKSDLESQGMPTFTINKIWRYNLSISMLFYMMIYHEIYHGPF